MQKKLREEMMMGITEIQWRAGSETCGAICAYESICSETTLDVSQGPNPANTAAHAFNPIVKKSKVPRPENQTSIY